MGWRRPAPSGAHLSTDRILCPGTRSVLEFLGKQVQLRLAVCSLNRSAGIILELLGIRYAFDKVYQPESSGSSSADEACCGDSWRTMSY